MFLYATLIENQPMNERLIDNLYQFKDEFIDSMIEDNEDVIFAVDHDYESVAMLLLENNGKFYVNEEARDRLRFHWKCNYEDNLMKFIPVMANQLNAGEFGVLGFTKTKELSA